MIGFMMHVDKLYRDKTVTQALKLQSVIILKFIVLLSDVLVWKKRKNEITIDLFTFLRSAVTSDERLSCSISYFGEKRQNLYHVRLHTFK